MLPRHVRFVRLRFKRFAGPSPTYKPCATTSPVFAQIRANPTGRTTTRGTGRRAIGVTSRRHRLHASVAAASLTVTALVGSAAFATPHSPARQVTWRRDEHGPRRGRLARTALERAAQRRRPGVGEQARRRRSALAQPRAADPGHQLDRPWRERRHGRRHPDPCRPPSCTAPSTAPTSLTRATRRWASRSATSIYASCGCPVLWVVVDFRRPASTVTVAAPAPKPGAEGRKHAATTKPAAAKPLPTQPLPTKPKVVAHASTRGRRAAGRRAAGDRRTSSPRRRLFAASSRRQRRRPNSGDPVGRMLNFATQVSLLND